MKHLSHTPQNRPSTDSFEYWWDMDGTWVEQPNIRRGGESGVKRCHLDGGTYYVKKQVGHIFRSLRHPLGCPTIIREAHRLSVCRKVGVATPEVVFCATRRHDGNQQALLVTRELSGYHCVQDWFAEEPDSSNKTRLLDAIYRRLAEALARLHNKRWHHGCLYDKHVFFKKADSDPEDVDVALIDLEKCRRRLTVARASERDIRQMRRHMPALDGRHWRIFVDTYAQYIHIKSSREKTWLSLTP